MMIEIIEATTDELIAKAKELIQEYAESLNFDLCFQNFDEELKGFPGQYSQPMGCLILALSENQPIGCVGLRYFDEGICEMKRLYVRPGFREKKAGRLLAETVIRSAQNIGYKYMRLDTLRSMGSANALYKKSGFKRIEPYRHNPIEEAVYMELNLKNYSD